MTKIEVCYCVKTKPHPASLHDRCVPPRGPEDADIMLIGMAPGMTEALNGDYFVGASGYELRMTAAKAGIPLAECRIQNVYQHWPRYHDPKNLTDEQREDGIQSLWKDIMAVDPVVIIPLGNEALEAIVGMKGISKWRGSVLQLHDYRPNVSVNPYIVPTYHPSAVIRSYDLQVLFQHDLKKAAKVARGEDMLPIERDLITVNSDNYRMTCTNYMVLAAEHGTPMAADIETFKGSIACISFSYKPEEALSVHCDDREVWQFILEQDNPKCWHNAMYDLTFLEAIEGATINGDQHDTQFMWHALHPELACSKMVGKRLALLVSLFTHDNYYKDTLQTWKKVADWEAFYEYNARDSAVTFEIWQELYADLVQRDLVHVYDYSIDLLRPYIDATKRGIRIDSRAKGTKAGVSKRRLATLEKDLLALAGQDFNPRSWQQIKAIFAKLGAPVKGTDKTEMTKVLLKYDPDSQPFKFATVLLDYKKEHKAYSTYYSFEYDDDSRVRTNWIIPGTETGRMANSKSIIFKGGANVMTIPRAARQFFIADEGYKLVYADLSQAEARIVAFMAGCEGLLNAFKTADAYKMVAAWMFDKEVEDITHDERYLGKRCVLGLLYGMGSTLWRTQINVDKGYDYISQSEANRLYELFFETFPEIRRYHNHIEQRVRRDHTLSSLILGRSRTFRPRNGRWEHHTFREAYDFAPQATVPEIVNYAVLGIIEETKPNEVQLLGQIHDAWFGQVKINKNFKTNVGIIRNQLVTPIDITDVFGEKRTLTIPVDVSVGHNWGDYNEETNPRGLR